MEYYYSFLQSLTRIIEDESKFFHQSDFIPNDLREAMKGAIDELVPILRSRAEDIGERDCHIHNLIYKKVNSDGIDPNNILLSSGLSENSHQKRMKLLAYSKALIEYEQCKTALNLFLVIDIGKTLYGSLSNVLFDSKYKTLLDEFFNISMDIYKKYVSL